ncbi:MAG: zinc dependent phospholipase C family protein, partial [Saprospiraceae bacterium]
RAPGASHPACAAAPAWGFFAHRRINRLAVLTLPPGMMVFFKPNIDWISDHATDADMRRYATSWEAPRHYIDLDNYGAPPFESLPRDFSEALRRHTALYGLTEAGDTALIFDAAPPPGDSLRGGYRSYFNRQVLPLFYQSERQLDIDSLHFFLEKIGDQRRFSSAFFTEGLSAHGILPWNLARMQRQLTGAFRKRDSQSIRRLCADMGHYIGDAHVPLHTTSNYNGQKTGQDGIHGFWESRIPELFADETYDYFVGKPAYIEDPAAFFWEITLESNRLVDSVLLFEKKLRADFPPDRQMWPDLRNGRVSLAPCREFAAAYQEAMDGMVERRMRAAIHAVASVWYTAWIDAGQPDLSNMNPPAADAREAADEQRIRQLYERGKILGRAETH